MINLFRAEWIKTGAGRGLLWVLPGMALLFTGLLTLLAVSTAPEQRDTLRRLLSGLSGGDGQIVLWPGMALFAWWLPTEAAGRAMMVALAVHIFAGEYQWRTWKNVLPRADRLRLLAVKYGTLVLYGFTACALYSLVLAAGMGIPVALTGAAYAPPLDSPLIGVFTDLFALRAGQALCSLAVAVGYAVLASTLTRSTIGGVVIGFLLLFAEAATWDLCRLLAFVIGDPDVLAVFRFSPAYNFQNLTYWALTGQGFTNPHSIAAGAPLTVPESFLVLIAWATALLALSALAFRRQDVTR